jgi:hypothetical protein
MLVGYEKILEDTGMTQCGRKLSRCCSRMRLNAVAVGWSVSGFEAGSVFSGKCWASVVLIL